MYRIPFSERDEEQLFFGLSLRESAVLALGGLITILLCCLIWSVFHVIYLEAIPVVVVMSTAYYIARGRVTMLKGEKDTNTTIDKYLMTTLNYRLRKHNYVAVKKDGFRC